MGKLGNWIDGLTDEQKDRIVTGQGWTTGILNNGDERCLIGHAKPHFSSHASMPDGHCECSHVGSAFDALCARFGLERIVRACKQRAAATMSSKVETPAPVEVMSADPLNSGYREGA